jgi:hypothetical protein
MDSSDLPELPDSSARTWRKSSYSGGNNENCVEVALTTKKAAIRDSKNPDGPFLLIPAAAWRFACTRFIR